MNVITRSFQMAFEPIWNKQPREATSLNTPARDSVFGRLVNAIKHRRRVNRAIRELNILNDDVLKDIGVERANIPELVGQLMASQTKPEVKQKSVSSASTHTDHPVADGATTVATA
jgi:uncharacterized protein YjiS (DUF1127 family)